MMHPSHVRVEDIIQIVPYETLARLSSQSIPSNLIYLHRRNTLRKMGHDSSHVDKHIQSLVSLGMLYVLDSALDAFLGVNVEWNDYYTPRSIVAQLLQCIRPSPSGCIDNGHVGGGFGRQRTNETQA